MASLWNELTKQQEEVIDGIPSSVVEFRQNTPGPPMFQEIYADAGATGTTRRIPLSYHTKACGWASDYPLMYRRVFVYLNPNPLSTLSLDEYILREFGCWRDTFVELVANKSIIPTLQGKNAYPDDIVREIEQLYADVWEINEDVMPRSVAVVDRFIETGATEADGIDQSLYKRADGGERVDTDKTIDHWKETVSPWTDLPDTDIGDLFDGDLFGVEVHGTVRDYVTERAVKLRLADETLDMFTDEGDSIDNIRTLAVEHANGTYREYQRTREQHERQLVRKTYVLWNEFGTPTYYSDLTGSFDMGPVPLRSGYVDQFKRSLERVGTRLGAERFNTHDTNHVPPIDFPVWVSDGADMDALFAIGPDDLQSLSVRDRYESLISRADAHRAYVREMFGDDGTMQALLDEADSYSDLLHIHNKEAESHQRFDSAKKIAASFGNGLVTGQSVLSIIDVAQQWETYADLLMGVGTTAAPGLGNLLVSAGSATLRVPERIGVARVQSIQRDDVAHGDVWRLPYGPQDRWQQFRWIGQETLVNTLRPL